MAANDWGSYEKGVFDTQNSEVNHAVLLAGYGVDEVTGEKYYKVRNSWGPEFGEDGERVSNNFVFLASWSRAGESRVHVT